MTGRDRADRACIILDPNPDPYTSFNNRENRQISIIYSPLQKEREMVLRRHLK